VDSGAVRKVERGAWIRARIVDLSAERLQNLAKSQNCVTDYFFRSIKIKNCATVHSAVNCKRAVTVFADFKEDF
jgi:hypothetical protein